MRRFLIAALVTLLLMLGSVAWACAQSPPPQGGVVHILYFYSVDCPHCQTVEQEVLKPLRQQYEDRLDLRMLEISQPANYELLIRTEEFFNLSPEERGLPTLVIDSQILIGEEQIRQELPCLLESCLAAGGTAWPPIPGLEEALETSQEGPLVGPGGAGTSGIEVCEQANTAICESEAPIWAAYFYQVGCQECSRAEADLRYIRSRYPQLIVEEFNIYENLPLAEWLAERAGRENELHTPALFIGDDALIGEAEITPQNLEALIEKYTPTGAAQSWSEFDQQTAVTRMIERFRSLGFLTVILAGLVDGLNPCAFATLIFFVAYLAASGRKGREILAAGSSFTLGVFVAYIVVGLGLYKALSLLGSWLTTLGRWVYGLTALLCAVLAVLSFLDFLKARRGQIEDMSLSLPEALKKRVRAVVRKGQRSGAYITATFFTGLLVSLLELACTGQIYLPTIIFVVSIPEMRARAIGYLLLYNLFFILPLVVVFALTCLGTTSLQLGLFIRRHAARVKLGTAVVFAVLAMWLGVALL